MDDHQTAEIQSNNCDSIDSLNSHLEVVEENTISMDEDNVSSEIHEISPDRGPTLPILQKIVSLSSKIQSLKEEHTILVSEAKNISTKFPSPEVEDALRLIGYEHEQLKKKYLEESSERKRLYNEVIELKGNIRVFCRCRPLNEGEIANGSNSGVEFDSSQDNELQIVSADSSKKQFKFDHVFKPEDSQEAVFGQTKPIVTSVLDGFNVCIFAYGQTGTGKTFTMEGPPENRGVNYRTLEELFRVSEQRSSVMKYELFVSMLEVYNEKIRDLLVENSNQPSKKLEIKQAADGTLEVPGLLEARAYGTEEVWELLKSGNKARSVGSTSANELSSRSHCLLRVTIKGENLINGQKTKSNLWLVDLAGSERVGKIEVEGERLKESQFINKSLSALGDVIAALASKTSHIPYRNSKLTHMLQSSLGGDCKTLMFVQISPSSSDLGETICSLNFASRVRGIESGPARKQVDHSELFKYKQMVEKLKHDEKESRKLQDNVQSLQLRLAARELVCKSLQDKARDLENQLAEERKTRIKQEARAHAQLPSGFSSFKQSTENGKTDRKPPLAPQRMPLRKITNLLPPPSPVPYRKFSANKKKSAMTDDRENNSKTSNMARDLMFPRHSSIAVRPPGTTSQAIQPWRRVSIATSVMTEENDSTISNMTAAKTRDFMIPRRSSIAIRAPATTSQSIQPRRRVSIATFRPESSLTTPLRSSAASQFKNGRQSFIKDPRKARYSKLFSPLPESSRPLDTSSPMESRRSSKFMGSPPTETKAWRPKHPTVVALERKSFVWSPLKIRSMQKFRRSPSILSGRSSVDMQQ